MSPIIAVIGASRGIGRELAKQLSQTADIEVISSTRSASQPESVAPNVKPITLDITNDASVTRAAKNVPELDTLIINAAMGYDDHLLDLSSTDFISYLNTNVVGPNRIICAFLPALLARKTRQIVILSSTAASHQLQIGSTFGLQGPYAVSKAAVNMLAVQYHNELHGQGFTVVPLHPGWVATEMGNLAGPGAMSVEESVNAVLKVVRNLKLEDSAKFLTYNQEILPW
jgi:NAD(P)-dependent dehydrogenase (short-subunit alcohol dehydrogenase family)